MMKSPEQTPGDRFTASEIMGVLEYSIICGKLTYKNGLIGLPEWNYCGDGRT